METDPMHIFKMSLPLVVVAALCFSATANAQSASAGQLGVSVSGVRSDSGAVRCGLYSSSNGFREPGAQFRGAVAPIRNGQAMCVFGGLPVGTYAVAVFHAEQNETRMETGAFGKPKQGYGFSRNPSSSFGPPDFSSAAFDYKGGNMTLSVQLHY
jgi:uncharacterized protein (DUF2141 family)